MYIAVVFLACVAISGFTEARIDPCGMPIISGNCLAYFPSWGYDKKAGKCVKFVYGGCGGNLNRFESEEQCQNACGLKNRCSQPIESGRCLAYFLSWGYDVKLGKCRPFVYGGCGGNSNRFMNREECEMVCGS